MNCATNLLALARIFLRSECVGVILLLQYSLRQESILPVAFAFLKPFRKLLHRGTTLPIAIFALEERALPCLL